MINSKAELMRALKEGRIRAFKTIKNDCSGKWIGIERKAGSKIQTNAFTILSPKDNGEMVLAYTWLEDINVSNNLITFKKAEKIGEIIIEIIEEEKQ